MPRVFTLCIRICVCSLRVHRIRFFSFVCTSMPCHRIVEKFFPRHCCTLRFVRSLIGKIQSNFALLTNKQKRKIHDSTLLEWWCYRVFWRHSKRARIDEVFVLAFPIYLIIDDQYIHSVSVCLSFSTLRRHLMFDTSRTWLRRQIVVHLFFFSYFFFLPVFLFFLAREKMNNRLENIVP